ncbi:baseplate J/gp47 family protein [Microgenomates group bacterium]|nr:baseplate J/gp47 family protein [Microgenomates group bacterium]
MPFFKKETPVSRNQVFSALISEKNLQALHWEVVDDHIEIISQSQIQNYASEDDASRALDLCLQEFGPESEAVSQIFFHLDSAFSDYAGLRPEKASFIKKITRDLNLDAAGFTANVDALEQVYQSSPNSRPYHLIIEYIDYKVIWSLFNRGSLIHEKTITLSDAPESREETLSALAEMKQLIRGQVADNLEIWCVSGLLSSQELRAKDLILDEQLLTVYFGNETLLEKVVPPSAVALARENGWLPADIQTESLDEPSPSPSESLDEPLADETTILDEQNDDNTFTPSVRKKRFSLKSLPRWAIITAASLIVLIVGFIIFWVSLVSGATAEIIISPKTVRVQKTETIKIDPQARASDFDNLILAGDLTQESLTSSDTIATTGKKDIGEHASGKIEIKNKVIGEDKTFAKGVQLTAGSTKFVLEDEVFVPAASENDDRAEFGKATVTISALEPGTDGNLSAGTRLSITNYDTSRYEAEVIEGGLSGGSSETAAMVTESDQKKLSDSLQEQMIKDAPLLLNKKEDAELYYIILAKQATATKKAWSTPVGEVADELELELTLSVPIVSYSAADLAPLAAAILDQEVPSGYVLSVDKPQLMSNADDEQKRGGEVSLKVDIESIAIAQPELSSLADDITNLDTIRALSKIRAIEGVNQVEITYSSVWYERLINKLPKPAKINITISTI